MSNVLGIGPFVFPYPLLLLVGAVVTAGFAARRSGRKHDVDVEPVLWRVLLVAIVVARLAYVYEFRSAYFEAPLSIIDIRDGGWTAVAGFAGALLYAANRTLRNPSLRKPVQWAFWTASSVWTAGSIVLPMSVDTTQRMPSLALTSLEGGTVRLESFEGRPTVVNLWATWCPPCLREMPVLQRAQAKHPSVNFVFVNQGESPAQVASWLVQRRLALDNVLLDASRKVGAALGHSAYPTTLFFDANGTLVGTWTGELSNALLLERLDRLTR